MRTWWPYLVLQCVAVVVPVPWIRAGSFDSETEGSRKLKIDCMFPTATVTGSDVSVNVKVTRT